MSFKIVLRRLSFLREANIEKYLLLFGKSLNGLAPPPIFLESFKELFVNLSLDQQKVLKYLEFGHPPLFSLENTQAKEKSM